MAVGLIQRRWKEGCPELEYSVNRPWSLAGRLSNLYEIFFGYIAFAKGRFGRECLLS
jgi:hypothetical protein